MMSPIDRKARQAMIAKRKRENRFAGMAIPNRRFARTSRTINPGK
jgi:hypothetical protein